MLRPSLSLALLAYAALALAQSTYTYTPAVPSPSTYNSFGGYGGYGGYGGGTVAGSAMQGMASVISAQGNYNLATSAAAVNLTQADRNDIENQRLWTQTYFEMRAMNRAATKSEKGPPPSKEQLVRIAAEGAPRPLGSNQVDPVTGQLAWPDLLQDPAFAQQRAAVEQLMAKKSQYGSLGVSDMNLAGDAIESMSGKLKDQIKNVPPQQYVPSSSFLKSLMYNMTRTQL